MVDFKKLREAKQRISVTNPIEIFRRLPKPPGIVDLYTSQAEALEAWYKRKNENDVVIKLHTGGGKTLVGLLIAQSILNEVHEPIIYLCPTNQLVEQTLNKAKEYGIFAEPYQKGKDLPDNFLTGKSVLICNYQALFNGISKFGAPGSARDVLKAGAIILDDAHVAFSTIRDSFTLNVAKKDDEEAYNTLTNMFRNDFEQINKLGTFDDVVSGADYNVLEIPYWSWKRRSKQVSEYLRKKKDEYPFVWPFLRDHFEYCHALISKNSFVATPIFPLVDLIPTFSNCSKRIYMSATISDDSSVIRTFNANYESISKPISSKSLAGTSERMILAPELMNFDIGNIPNTIRNIAKWGAEKQNVGTVILTSSDVSAKKWTDIATYAETTHKVSDCVKELQENKTFGPIVFANRYDGIDLPHDSCRLLIISDLPQGASEYDMYRSNTFLSGSAINNALSLRIEQGMGRAARGTGDYCVVIITGKNLIAWISRSANLKFLTSATRAQLKIGLDVSKDVADLKGLADTINACFRRDKDWIEYHAETLAESIEPEEIDITTLKHAQVEQKAFQLWRDNYHPKAIKKLEKYCDEKDNLDNEYKGWLFQLAARIAYSYGNEDKAQELQGKAFANNRNLIRPKAAVEYTKMIKPGDQAIGIAKNIQAFSFKKGIIAEFNEITSHLVPEASANQFENSLEKLGEFLGFSSERPENIYKVGPDVLWLLPNNTGLVIEAKSRKKIKNQLTKDNHGQLLISVEWFKKEYPSLLHIPVSIHPNINATKNAMAYNVKALTYEKLNELITEVRDLLEELSQSTFDYNELILMCQKLLDNSNLTPNNLTNRYLLKFDG